MTSKEKSINLGSLFLTYKPEKKPINTCTSFFCMYWYVSIFSEKSFWPQYMYLTFSPNNGFRWCPVGKLSHLGLEQLSASVLLLPWLGLIYFGVKASFLKPILCKAWERKNRFGGLFNRAFFFGLWDYAAGTVEGWTCAHVHACT